MLIVVKTVLILSIRFSNNTRTTYRDSYHDHDHDHDHDHEKKTGANKDRDNDNQSITMMIIITTRKRFGLMVASIMGY